MSPIFLGGGVTGFYFLIHTGLKLQLASQMGLGVSHHAQPSCSLRKGMARDTSFMLSVKDRALVSNMSKYAEKGPKSVPHTEPEGPL